MTTSSFVGVRLDMFGCAMVRVIQQHCVWYVYRTRMSPHSKNRASVQPPWKQQSFLTWLPWSLRRSSMEALCSAPWRLHGSMANSTAAPRQLYGASMEFLWNFYGSTEVLWMLHEASTASTEVPCRCRTLIRFLYGGPWSHGVSMKIYRGPWRSIENRGG